MEDVLDVYQRPYDPKRPVVCFDECSKELRGTPHGSIEASPGQPERIDYEYERNGTANAFLWVEPFIGKRNTHITDTRTSIDCAEAIEIVIDEDYPEAEKEVLVLDNLSTHTPAALYERFEPAEAHRIANKIEWHYTPEHASWLNMAEIELSILAKQCLNRRIADKQMLRREISTWQNERERISRNNLARILFTLRWFVSGFPGWVDWSVCWVISQTSNPQIPKYRQGLVHDEHFWIPAFAGMTGGAGITWLAWK